MPIQIHADGDAVSMSNPIPTMAHRAPTADRFTIAASATEVQLLAENSSRHAYTIWNGADTTMYVAAGTGVSANSFSYKLEPGEYYEPTSPVAYTGVFSAVWAGSPTGSAQVTEYN